MCSSDLLKDIERERSQCEENLTAVYQELKSLEIAAEQQARRAAEAEDRSSQARLDELALVRHLRKHAIRQI